MKKNHLILLAAAFATTGFLSAGCNNAAPVTEEAKTETAATVNAAATNPNFEIAPLEYAELAEKALMHVAAFEFDVWGEMLADNVVFSFPDGDVDTRTKLEGKAAVIAWWKGWKEKSGVESMSMSEFNHFPLNVTGDPKGGALKGMYDFAYLSNKMVFGGKTVSLRMNFITHFNAEKKIDRYTTYYDRSVIINATGKNMLEELKTKK